MNRSDELMAILKDKASVINEKYNDGSMTASAYRYEIAKFTIDNRDIISELISCAPDEYIVKLDPWDGFENKCKVYTVNRDVEDEN